MAKASVIIPCYNQGRYLSSALQSVQGQTFQDWEAIVVDDGSTDSTAAAVARSTDPRIRYVYQENQGLSAARNTGICSASGACLAFLDADDEWQPGFLERCLDVLRSNQRLAGVYSRTAFIDVRGTVLPQIGGEVVPPGGGVLPCTRCADPHRCPAPRGRL
jgi:glycosyltransferase involved in cell wall biosynthesis